ncbi:GNAT family N-acetyltransferase [Sulfuricurvum sp.]|uniref:GNAT family N-acetyltransferase n=1 Tax=Sulfuricurvum sp. TaxID=2025608 RepID=UPI003BB4A13C
MNKSGQHHMNMVLTPAFVKKWKLAYQKFYGYKEIGNFLAVPSLGIGYTLAYVPGLTYTDIHKEEANRLITEAQDNKYIIRALDPSKQIFKPFEPVTMRKWIGGESHDKIVSAFHSTKRRNLRKALEYNMDVQIGWTEKLREDFYSLYRLTMYRLGTPPLSKELFVCVGNEIEIEITVAYVSGKPAAGLLVVYDEEIAWNPYAASDRRFADTFANEVVYRDAMFRAFDKGKKIFDCGRSPYGGGTYQFKKKMGAKPVGLAYFKEKEENIYAKYSFVSKVWKRIPKLIADGVGPKLRRYLADS